MTPQSLEAAAREANEKRAIVMQSRDYEFGFIEGAQWQRERDNPAYEAVSCLRAISEGTAELGGDKHCLALTATAILAELGEGEK